MMNITPRQRQILELLLRNQEEITASQIAAEVKVSTRTVHREMSEVEQIASTFGLFLEKKSGRGFQIMGDPESLQSALYGLSEAGQSGYSAEDRKWLIVGSLLNEDEPIKLFSLAHDLKVAVATVSNELDDVEDWIKRFGLSLVRRRGYGVEIEGLEVHKRRAISQLALDHLDYSDLFGQANTSRDALTELLLQMTSKGNLLEVENALWAAGEKWLEKLPETIYTQLLIELSVALARIGEGKTINDPGNAPDSDLSLAQEVSPDKADKVPNPLPHSYEAAEHIVKHLPSLIPGEVRTEEIRYLAGLLSRAENTFSLLDFTHVDVVMLENIQRLITGMERRMGVPFQEDRSLREGLLDHIEPAMHRIREGERVRNPLLGQIKKDYELLFESVRSVVDEMKIPLMVPDEEIGFLVMHFGASMERLKQFGRSVRAILVCTSGIGSSKLLATRIKKEMPQVEVLGNVSWYEAARLPEENYDLIISTVDLPLEASRYIKLSPLLTERDTERLRDYIQGTTLLQRPKAEGTVQASPDKRYELDWLKSLRISLNEIVNLIDHFVIYQLDNSSTGLQETLWKACEFLREDQILTDTDHVVKRLIEREQLGSLVIPDTSLALFHTRSQFISRPSFTLFRLAEPMVLEGNEPASVRQLLIMLGPKELSKESLEVLSEISALLLKAEMVELLETGTQNEIKQYLSAELIHFFENKR